MDNIFHLQDSDRAAFLTSLMHSFGCSYICLWLHISPHNYLQSKDGYYCEDLSEHQASSSSGSLASRLFDEYRLQTIFFVEHDVVPGLAFKQSNPCVVLRDFELHRFISTDLQRQFYLEAKIKIAVFMGCRSGEIELGMSTAPQMNIEMELRNLFPQDFQSLNLPLPQLPMSLQESQVQQNKPSPSSSKPMDNFEYSSFHFNMTSMGQAFPTPESTDTAIFNAMLAVLSSPISTSSSLLRVRQETSNINLDQPRIRGDLSAFKEFSGASRPSIQVFQEPSSAGFRKENMMKKTVLFYRRLNVKRLQDLTHPSRSQHVLKERKRREKINDYFQALRPLLPPGTKKDKVTVLRTSKDYLNSLQDQVSQLSRREKLLESQLFFVKPTIKGDDEDTSIGGFSSSERFRVRLAPITESSSDEERIMDLQVSVRVDDVVSLFDLVIRLLGFLKAAQEVRLGSIGTQTLMASSHEEQQGEQQHSSINRVTLRLIVEGSDWDQSAFLEAVRRVIADL